MDRKATILAGISAADVGLEIAPWFSPVAAKRDGYNIRVLDVFTRAQLLERARADASISVASHDLLEDVDFVGSATEIAALVPAALHGGFDYIVSSHNFEHLANPIKFLRGCQVLLQPGGLLSMAVPDGRVCFDHFRPHTMIGEWLQAYLEDRSQPTGRQVFELHSAISALRQEDRLLTSFSPEDLPGAVEVTGDIVKSWRDWQKAALGDGYVDSHCTVMTPASFRLLVLECRYLGLLDLEIESVSEVMGGEFFIRMRRGGPVAIPGAGAIRAERTRLMRRIWEERALCVIAPPEPAKAEPDVPQTPQRWSRRVRSLSRRLRGKAG